VQVHYNGNAYVDVVDPDPVESETFAGYRSGKIILGPDSSGSKMISKENYSDKLKI